MARVSVSVARIYFHAGFRYLPMGNLLGVAFPNPLDLRWIANRRVTHRVTNNLQQLTATVCEAPFRFSMICQIWRNLVPVVLCRRRTRAPVTGPHVGVLRSTSASRCISVRWERRCAPCSRAFPSSPRATPWSPTIPSRAARTCPTSR